MTAASSSAGAITSAGAEVPKSQPTSQSARLDLARPRAAVHLRADPCGGRIVVRSRLLCDEPRLPAVSAQGLHPALVFQHLSGSVAFDAQQPRSRHGGRIWRDPFRCSGSARAGSRQFACKQRDFDSLRSPLQIPFIVVGVAFLQASYALAPSIGINLHDSPAAIFLAHLLVATPYVIGATGSRLAQLSPRFDEAALTLGASRWRAFRRVTFPLILPSVFSGALFAFLVSFTDVTIALFLTPKGYVTFPIWVFHSIQNDLESSVPAASTLVFLLSAAAIFLLQRLAGMESVLRSGGAKG